MSLGISVYTTQLNDKYCQMVHDNNGNIVRFNLIPAKGELLKV